MKIADKEIPPVFITAEIGINHNGDLKIAKKLIQEAARIGCDAVKFQKRTPELCIPPQMKKQPKYTPWGLIPYIDYKHKLEFGQKEYEAIDRECRRNKIIWYASCWDEPSVDFIAQFNPPVWKVASPAVAYLDLIKKIDEFGKPIIMSTGMSTMDEIDRAIGAVHKSDLIVLHCNSSYPAKNEHLNLRVIKTLQQEFPVPIGYSGHETGLATTIAAVALGAVAIERHITLDRSMWGSDQAASVEIRGFEKLVKDIRAVELAMGDGVKRVWPEELKVKEKLRWK